MIQYVSLKDLSDCINLHPGLCIKL